MYIYIKLHNVRSDSEVFSEFSFTESNVNVPKKSCIRISQYNSYLSIFNPNPFQFKSHLVELTDPHCFVKTKAFC